MHRTEILYKIIYKIYENKPFVNIIVYLFQIINFYIFIHFLHHE